jgi:uncharacterized membrane protein YgcG
MFQRALKLLPAFVAGWLIVVGSAPAQEKGKDKAPGLAPTVYDEAKLFSEAARQEADQAIAEIRRRYRKDLFIETMANPRGKDANSLGGVERPKFFRELAAERAKKNGVQGIYVLISLNPKYVQVLSDNATRKEGLFTAANDQALADKIIAKLKANAPNEALKGAVAYVNDTLGRTAKAEAAAGPPRTVVDEAGLFSEEAKKKANAAIAEIKERYRKDLLVETLKSLPEGKKVGLTSAREKQEFFQKLADERARKAGVHGIYVLITVQPKYVEVVSGPATRREGLFTVADDRALAQKFIAKLRAGQPDEALLDGVAYVRQTLSKAPPPPK